MIAPATTFKQNLVENRRCDDEALVGPPARAVVVEGISREKHAEFQVGPEAAHAEQVSKPDDNIERVSDILALVRRNLIHLGG